MFKPLEHIDFSGLYTSYAVLIDLAVYLLVFIGLAQVTLGKRFQGSGGKAVIIGIGVCLAVSLAIAEQALGFSLRSFGPVAAGLFLAVLGVMIFQLVKHLGGSTEFSGSIAYINVMLLVVATVPGFFGWINETMPILNVGLLLGFLLAGYLIISHAFRKKGMTEKFGPVLEKAREELKAMPAMLSESQRYQKTQIKPMTKKAYKESRNVLEELKKLVPVVQKYGHLPDARDDLRVQINQVLPQQLELSERLTQLQWLHKRILQADASAYSARTRNQLNKLDGAARAAMKQELSDEYRKLGIERQLSDIEGKMQPYQSEVRRCLEQASISIENGDPDSTVSLLQRAISCEDQSVSMIDSLRSLERQMLKHTKKEIRLEKRALAVAHA
jgi:hypothetical protein